VQIFDVPLWPSERATAFLTDRVRLHIHGSETGVVECSDEERWARSTKYALMKEGRKSALKLYDNMSEAMAAQNSKDTYVEERPGLQVRCESYCAVSSFCPQFARLKQTQE
jgi:hypothetical protein